MAEYIERDAIVAWIEKQKRLSKLLTIMMIQETPAADVAPVVHGRWIRRGNEKKCSVCGFIYYSNNDEWNGCPNCLAKMDGGDGNG